MFGTKRITFRTSQKPLICQSRDIKHLHDFKRFWVRWKSNSTDQTIYGLLMQVVNSDISLLHIEFTSGCFSQSLFPLQLFCQVVRLLDWHWKWSHRCTCLRALVTLAIVRLLLDNDTDLYAVDKEDLARLTPAGCAKLFAQKEVEQFLEKSIHCHCKTIHKFHKFLKFLFLFFFFSSKFCSYTIVGPHQLFSWF